MELGEYNGWCEYCKQSNIIIYNPNLREIRIKHLIDGDKPMTPEEQLFADFFNKHINILHQYVIDMDLLEIRAYREKLSLIAKEAKAGIYAADEAEKEILKKKNGDNKPKGFARSLNTDDTTTDAINIVRERQKRLTKQEKIQAKLEKLGISSVDAAKLMSAGTILGKFKSKTKIINEQKEPEKPDSCKPRLFNPFEKKE